MHPCLLQAAYLASVNYAIGYIDSGHGHDDGLAEVELQNKEGLFQSSLEAAERGGIALAAAQALEQGVVPSDPLESFENVSCHNMPGNVTWPIVALSYIYVDTNQTMTGATGALLKAWLTYIISDEGQSLVEDYNFVGVPSAIKSVAQKAIDYLELEYNISEWSFETTTQKGGGMEPYVISGKRRSWYEYAVSNLEGDIEDNSDLIADNYDALDTRLSSVESSVDKLKDDDDDLPDWVKDPQVGTDPKKSPNSKRRNKMLGASKASVSVNYTLPF